MTTVDDALTTYVTDALKAKLITYLQERRTAVTDWNDSGFLRSLLMLWAEDALADVLGPADPLPKARAALAAGVVPALAALQTDATSEWLTLVADQWFGIRRNFKLDGTQFAGTFTQQAVTLSCDASHGPYSVAAGAFWVRSAVTGNRYRAISSGTIPNNGSVLIAVQAESPNDSLHGASFADGPGTLTDLSDNPLPGVTASNVAPSFSAVFPSPNPANGLGVVTVGGSTPVSPTAYDVKIVVSGQVGGAAKLQYRANGGPWSSSTPGGDPVVSSYVIPSGPTVNFANDGGGADPSFISGDVYSFTSPGSPITQQGLDPETDTALLVRCVARWPSLEVGTVVDKHVTWAKEASALVMRAKAERSATKPGFIDLTIAGATNPLSGGTVSTVQTYIDQREGITDQTVVTAATVVGITGSGEVRVVSANLATVQAAAAALWNAYVNGTDIGGVVRAAKLVQILMDCGAVAANFVTINSSQEVELGASEVAAYVDIITGPGALGWLGV
jgi:hypothetical protein